MTSMIVFDPQMCILGWVGIVCDVHRNLQDRLLAKEKELIRHREIVDEVRQPLRDDAFSAVEDATEEPTTQSAQV